MMTFNLEDEIWGWTFLALLFQLTWWLHAFVPAAGGARTAYVTDPTTGEPLRLVGRDFSLWIRHKKEKIEKADHRLMCIHASRARPLSPPTHLQPLLQTVPFGKIRLRSLHHLHLICVYTPEYRK